MSFCYIIVTKKHCNYLSYIFNTFSLKILLLPRSIFTDTICFIVLVCVLFLTVQELCWCRIQSHLIYSNFNKQALLRNLVRMIYNYTRLYVIIRKCVECISSNTVILYMFQFLYIRQVCMWISTFMHVHNFNHHSGDSTLCSTRRITLLLGNVSNPFLLLKLLYLAYVDVSVSFSCTSIPSKCVAYCKETDSTRSASFFFS